MQNFCILNVQKKLIQKDESDGNICIDVAMQRGVLQCSYIAVILKFRAVKYNAVQLSGYCCSAEQLSVF